MLGVLLLALVGLTYARNLSLVLLDNASSASVIYYNIRISTLPARREPFAWTARLRGITSGEGAGAALTSGSFTREAAGGATATRTVSSEAGPGSAHPVPGTAPWRSAAYSRTIRASMANSSTGTWFISCIATEAPSPATGIQPYLLATSFLCFIFVPEKSQLLLEEQNSTLG